MGVPVRVRTNTIAIVAVVAMLGGCRSDSVTDDSIVPAAVGTANEAAFSRLPAGVRMRAIALRARLSRAITGSNETFVRHYDAAGRVMSEQVLRDGKLVDRPSTLATSVAGEPMMAFVANGGARLVSGTLKTMNWSPDLDSVTTGSEADSVWTDAVAGVDVTTRDGNSPVLMGASTLYYGTHSDAGDGVTLSTEADLVFSVDNDDSHMDEYSYSPSDWVTVIAAVVADTGGSSIRQSTYGARGDAALMMLPTDPCGDVKLLAVSASLRALVWVIAATQDWEIPIIGAITAGEARESVRGAAAAAGAVVACIAAHHIIA